jgi:hypothetical protein
MLLFLLFESSNITYGSPLEDLIIANQEFLDYLGAK